MTTAKPLSYLAVAVSAQSGAVENIDGQAGTLAVQSQFAYPGPRKPACRILGALAGGLPVAGINFLKVTMQESLKTCLFGNCPGRRSEERRVGNECTGRRAAEPRS